MTRLKEQRGASAVEFAIVASLLLMILFGTITFGIVLNRYQGLQAAGREGARLASLPSTTRAEIVDRVKQSLSIISASSMVDDCGSSPLSVEQGCIDVFVRPEASSAQASWTEYTLGTETPCTSPPGGEPAVIVQVFYRLRIDIPLWSSPQMTLSGSGEFRCEQ